MPPEIQIRDEIDLERLRVRLRGMTDEQLRRFGKAARYMVSPYANLGKPPLPAFVNQLGEARAEWRRRHPKSTSPANSRQSRSSCSGSLVKAGVDPSLISTKGFGKSKLLVRDSNAKARSANRRVEIGIVYTTPVSSKPSPI
jgi:hypothetical protein